MPDKTFTAAIIGCGNRGTDVYGNIMHGMPDKYKITALCDINAERLDIAGKKFDVPDALRFIDEVEFFAEKRADVLVIATLDGDHVRQAVRALELGYDILLEKPITDKIEECEKLLAARKNYGGKIIVCHVLRYSPAFLECAKILQSGELGRLVAIQAIEQVAYWHQAHSFVRGNWRNREETAPMILAKCCHDIDLLQYYAQSECDSVSSVGDLAYFNPDNAPDGATARCCDCPHVDSCAYSAVKLYIDDWKNKGCPAHKWPQCVITNARPLTEPALIKALREGPYGRCVFACDNNVVDHQLSDFVFKNGVKASLLMTAFTANGGRNIRFCCTLGELVLDEESGYIAVKPFGASQRAIDIKSLGGDANGGHGGGDYGIIEALYAALNGNNAAGVTTLEQSIESHLMALRAEQSRLAGGKTLAVHDDN